VIGEAAEAGIRKIVLVLAPGSVEPLYRPIKEALDLMVVPSLEHCSCEQARPEGLGDAVLQAEALVGRGPFAVLLPDDVLREPGPRKTHATEFHRMMEAIAQLEEGQVVAVHHVPKSKMPHCGVARLAAKEVMPRIFPIEELIEKPDPSHPICRGERAYGIVGRYLLQPAIFKALRALKKKGLRPLHITAALEHLRREGQGVYAFKVEARREDIGEALDQAGELLRDHMTG
jgi:UTP--glucose-1-phosphate uridylyltransferase